MQAFYLANRFHDHLAALGFNAAAGAFEGVDQLQLNTFDGASTGPDANHVNNANMYTPPDGTSPLMQMYLFRNPNFRNGMSGDDADVLFHEYTHGLSNRLITDAAGAGALNSAQAGAMGEAWSDWYAQDYIVDQFPSLDTSFAGEVSMGAYFDFAGGSSRLRTEPIDCPVGGDPIACPGRAGVGTGGYTYGDFGRIVGTPEVHADGEIWSQTLWDLRAALGSARAEALITGGMALTPPEPSMLDARNAILLADVTLYEGADTARLWSLFAARGMGYFAAAIDGDDTSPTESFALPPADGGPVGTITGVVTDSLTGAPVAGVRVYVGGLSSFSAVTGSDGHYSITGVPQGTYTKVVAGGAGYDNVVSSLSVPGGSSITFSPSVRRDWAAVPGGATLVSSNGNEYANQGCGADKALDQSTGSGWSTNSGTDKNLVVQLPSVVNISQFGLDPTETCGDTAASALGNYRVETSPDGIGLDDGVRRLLHLREPPPDELRHPDRGRGRRALRAADAGPVDGRRPSRTSPSSASTEPPPTPPTTPRRRRRSRRAGRRSSSRRLRRARRSSASSTRAPSPRAPRRIRSARWRTAPTPSRSARSTPRATSIRLRPRARSRSTRRRRTRRWRRVGRRSAFTSSEAGSTFECKLDGASAGHVRGVHVAVFARVVGGWDVHVLGPGA